MTSPPPRARALTAALSRLRGIRTDAWRNLQGRKKKEGGRKELTNPLSALLSPKKRPPSFELIFPSLCTSCFHLISSLSILLSLEDEPGKLMRVHPSFSPSLRFPSRSAFNSFVLCSSKPFSIHETFSTSQEPSCLNTNPAEVLPLSLHFYRARSQTPALLRVPPSQTSSPLSCRLAVEVKL